MLNFCLTTETKKGTFIVREQVTSHLDYCNSLLIGTTQRNINKMQRIQNLAAKIILKKKPRDSATGCLRELHWLPIAQRIDFKIATMVWKALHGTAPRYLEDLLKRYTPAT